MAEDRRPSQTKIRAPGFRPSASPVNRFSRTSDGTNLARLADALQSVAPGLRKYAHQVDKRQDEEAALAGEEATVETQKEMRERRLNLQEAQREGLLKNHEDPITQAVYREGLGRTAAHKAMDEFQVFKAKNLSEATTMDEYDQAFDEFIDQWTEDNLGGNAEEPALGNAFFTTLQESQLRDRRGFSNSMSQKLKDQLNTTLYAGISTGVQGLFSAGEGTPEALAETVSRELEAFRLAGSGSAAENRLGMRTAVEATIDAAVQWASTSDSPLRARAVLDALAKVPTTQGHTLATHSDDLAERIQQGRNELSSAISFNRGMAENQRQGAIRAVHGDAMEAFAEDPLNADIQPFITRLSELDAPVGSIAQLRNLQRAIAADPANRDNPESLRSLTDMVWGTQVAPENKMPRLLGALRNKDITPNTFMGLANQLRGVLGDRLGGSAEADIFRDGEFRTFVDNKENSFGTKFNTATDLDVQLWAEAEPAIRREWFEFMQGNPDATLRERQDFLSELGERVDEVFLSHTLDSFSPVPQSKWMTDQVISERQFGLLTDAVSGEEITLPAVSEERDSFYSALNRLGITPNFEDPDFTMQEIGLALKAQAPHMDVTALEGLSEPESAPSEPETEPETEPEETRLDPIREEFQDLSDEELQNSLAESITRFRELDDSLGLFRGLGITDLGTPSASLGFSEDAEEFSELRDRIGVLNALIQKRGIELPDLASNE